MTTVAAPTCGGCKHLRGTLRDPKCDAFPAGIPWEILLSQKDHRQPYPGDNGIQFEPKDKSATDYAESLFKRDAS
jgi:hypothetical protein